MDPAHAFPDATGALPASELGGVLDAASEPSEVDSAEVAPSVEDDVAPSVDDDDVAPSVEDDVGGAEGASATLPTDGALLAEPPAELPPAHPVTVRVRQTMAAKPLNTWVRRMGVTTLHSMGCWAVSDRVITTGLCKECCGRHFSVTSGRAG